MQWASCLWIVLPIILRDINSTELEIPHESELFGLAEHLELNIRHEHCHFQGRRGVIVPEVSQRPLSIQEAIIFVRPCRD